MTKILLFSSHDPESPGGIQTVIRNLEKGLKELGHDVFHQILERDTKFPRHHYFPRKISYLATRSVDYPYFNYVRSEASKIIQAVNPDVIHATHIRLWPAIQIASKRGIPTIVSTHAKELGYEQLAKSVFKSASVVHAVSSFTENLVHELSPGVDTWVIHPSIDVKFYQRFAKPPEKRSGVMTLSRFVDRKNIRTLIDAWKRLPEEITDGRELKVVGDGSNRKALERKAKDRQDIRFYGFVDDEEKARMLGESELFVLTPLRDGYVVEGFGIVWIEAQATGTPVIGSSFGGAPEAIDDAGIIVDFPTDTEHIANVIKKMLRSQLKEYRKAASARIHNFNVLNIAKQHEEVYQQLLCP